MVKGEEEMSQKKYSSEFNAKGSHRSHQGGKRPYLRLPQDGIHPSQVRAWKREFLSKASLVFDKSQNREKTVREENRYSLSSDREVDHRKKFFIEKVRSSLSVKE